MRYPLLCLIRLLTLHPTTTIVIAIIDIINQEILLKVLPKANFSVNTTMVIHIARIGAFIFMGILTGMFCMELSISV